MAAEIKGLHQRLSRPQWCAAYIGPNGCTNGRDCPHGAHVDLETVQALKAAAKRQSAAARAKSAAAKSAAAKPAAKADVKRKSKK